MASTITIGVMELYQNNIVSYGKNAEGDLLSLSADKKTATITATGVDGAIKSGDVIVVKPFIASGVVTLPADDETLLLTVGYFRNGKGYITKDVVVTFNTVGDIGNVVTQINTALASNGLSTVVKAVAGATALTFKLVGITYDSMFSAENGTWTSGTFVEETPSKSLYLGVASEVSAVDTVIPVAIRYESNSDALVETEFTDVDYEIVRNIGEMTGSTINSSLDPVMYKGLSKVAKQVEYAEGSATLSAEEVAFTEDNLQYVYGWSKNEAGEFFTGKAVGNSTNPTVKYSFTEDTIPATIGLMGLHKTINGELIVFSAERAKTLDLDLSMKKTEFRTYSAEYTLLTPVSKAVWKLLKI